MSYHNLSYLFSIEYFSSKKKYYGFVCNKLFKRTNIMEDKYVHNDMCRNRQDFNGCVLELFILSLICYRHDITEIVLKVALNTINQT